MKIQHNKFSIFLLEQYIYDPQRDDLHVVDKIPTFKYYETFESLKRAQEIQKEIEEKSIIIPTY